MSHQIVILIENYCSRTSKPQNDQTDENIQPLLRYCNNDDRIIIISNKNIQYEEIVMIMLILLLKIIKISYNTIIRLISIPTTIEAISEVNTCKIIND